MTEQTAIITPIVTDEKSSDNDRTVSVANMDKTDWTTMLMEMRIISA